MIEITPGEALDLHLKGEKVWLLVPMDDAFAVYQLKQYRCFKAEATALKEKVEELAGQAEAKPKEEPKRAPKGSRKEPTTTKPKPLVDHGKIVALVRCNIKTPGSWPVKKIADEMGISEASVYNHINKAKELGEL